MDVRRLRPAEWVLAAGALALVVALFLPWYAVAGLSSTGGGAFRGVEVLRALCALAAGVAVALQPTRRSPALPGVSGVAAPGAGIVAAVGVVVKLLDPPLGGSVDVRVGAWVGLAA